MCLWPVHLEINRGTVVRVPGQKHEAHQRQEIGEGAKAQYVVRGGQQRDMFPGAVLIEITQGTVVESAKQEGSGALAQRVPFEVCANGRLPLASPP